MLYNTANNELVFKIADSRKIANAELQQSFSADNSYHAYSVVVNMTTPDLDRIYHEIDEVAMCLLVLCSVYRQSQ